MWRQEQHQCHSLHSVWQWIGRKYVYVTLMIVNKTGNVRVMQHWGAFVQPLLLWKSNKCYILWVCVCSLRYPACNAHAPYCHLWPACLYGIFPHYFIPGMIFGEKLLNIKCVFWFTQLLLFRNISHSENWARYEQKRTSIFIQNIRYSCHTLTF